MSEVWTSDSQFAAGGTITMTDKVSVYDYDRYLNRMRGVGGAAPNMKPFCTGSTQWDWAENAGHNRIDSGTPMPYKRLPRLTKDSVERLGYKNVGETINVEAVLWTGNDVFWNRGRFQAIKFTFNGKAAFAWVVYNNKVYFNIPSPAPAPEPTPAPPPREVRRHTVTDDELRDGWTPDTRYEWELIFPVYRVRINKNIHSVKDSDRMKLIGKDGDFPGANVIYQKTLPLGENKIEDGQYLEIRFSATPRNLYYTLEVEPGPDNTEKNAVYNLFKDAPYHGS